MEKVQQQKAAQSRKGTKPLVWDCGSSLYDSFELKSFERQLDSAISSSSRTLSMPHVTDRRAQPQQPQPQPLSKKSSKISRSLHKLIRSVFRPKQNNTSSLFQVHQERSQDGVYVVYNRYGALTTIPEVPEDIVAAAAAEYHDAPEIRSLVGRSASDRFTSTSIGISCA